MASQRPVFDPTRIAPPTVPAGPKLLTVSQLNSLIKGVLADALPGTIHLVGEISNFARHGSGHLYLTIKDDTSEIRAVMWRSAAAPLKFKPQDGLEVVATGYVDVYETRGQYQFYIRRLEPRGVGALELAFRQLYEKLAREGLFDPLRKRPIPRFPRHIAVVTSPTGAAIRDIIHTLRRRCCAASILLHPARVQGEGAAAEIATAIGRLNQLAARLGGIDVIIVGRGGGSLEDLWAFNEEVVARAICASVIPIISAVGHEVDTTIADLCADLRAPTPTAAAELAVPVLDEILDDLRDGRARLRHAIRGRLELARAQLVGVQRCEWIRDPCAALRRNEQQLDEAVSRLHLCATRRVNAFRTRLHAQETAMAAIQPAALLRHEHDQLGQVVHRLRWAMQSRMLLARRYADRSREALLLRSPEHRVRSAAEIALQRLQALNRALSHRLEIARRAVETAVARLDASSHRQVLARGFSITRTKRGRRIVAAAEQVAPGEILLTETAGGEIESRVLNPRQPELFD
ncbi:MAG: hypothetical protein AMXMBFR13_00900 [Phycisphaerae bacterium]